MRYTLFIILSLVGVQVFAQKAVRQAVRQGNGQYEKEDYLNAEISYRKALDAGPNDSIAAYNLANSLYRQQDNEKAQEAMQKYMASAESARKSGNKTLAAKSYFNAGDLMMATQQYDKALGLFKQSLKCDPADDEARYNMLLAQKLMQQQQNEDQQDDQKQDDKQDQQQDQQEKPQDQNQDQQDQNQDQQHQGQQQQEQQPQEQPGQMSKEQAEAILDANNRDEKETQQRVQEAQMQKVRQRHTGKDW